MCGRGYLVIRAPNIYIALFLRNLQLNFSSGENVEASVVFEVQAFKETRSFANYTSQNQMNYRSIFLD